MQTDAGFRDDQTNGTSQSGWIVRNTFLDDANDMLDDNMNVRHCRSEPVTLHQKRGSRVLAMAPTMTVVAEEHCDHGQAEFLEEPLYGQHRSRAGSVSSVCSDGVSEAAGDGEQFRTMLTDYSMTHQHSRATASSRDRFGTNSMTKYDYSPKSGSYEASQSSCNSPMRVVSREPSTKFFPDLLEESQPVVVRCVSSQGGSGGSQVVGRKSTNSSYVSNRISVSSSDSPRTRVNTDSSLEYADRLPEERQPAGSYSPMRVPTTSTFNCLPLGTDAPPLSTLPPSVDDMSGVRPGQHQQRVISLATDGSPLCVMPAGVPSALRQQWDGGYYYYYPMHQEEYWAPWYEESAPSKPKRQGSGRQTRGIGGARPAERHRQNGQRNGLHMEPEEPVPQTTVCLRELPEGISRDLVVEALASNGFQIDCDFAYVPMKFGSKAAIGYAFVNFVSHEAAVRCFEKMNDFRSWGIACSIGCKVTWSEGDQGLKAIIERHRNGPVMHHSVPDEAKPALFKNGVRQPFPAPTKNIRPPRPKRYKAEAAGQEEDPAEAQDN